MKFIFLLLFLLVAVTAHAQQQPIPLQGCANAGYCTFGGLIFNGATITWATDSAPRYLMIFDSPTLPANGPTTICGPSTGSGCMAYCVYLSESATAPNRVPIDWTGHPVLMHYGTTVALSTAADCNTLTIDLGSNFFFSQTR